MSVDRRVAILSGLGAVGSAACKIVNPFERQQPKDKNLERVINYYPEIQRLPLQSQGEVKTDHNLTWFNYSKDALFIQNNARIIMQYLESLARQGKTFSYKRGATEIPFSYAPQTPTRDSLLILIPARAPKFDAERAKAIDQKILDEGRMMQEPLLAIMPTVTTAVEARTLSPFLDPDMAMNFAFTVLISTHIVRPTVQDSSLKDVLYHSLAAAITVRQKGELYQKYRDEMSIQSYGTDPNKPRDPIFVLPASDYNSMPQFGKVLARR